MEFREATPGDAEAIQAVARASLHASYDDVLDEDTVEEAVDQWYDPDQFAADLDEESLAFVVAEEEGVRSGDPETTDVVGFAQALLPADGDAGRVQWLHVHPDHRGEGVGADLLAHTEAVLAERGADHVVGEVLADNEAGNEFYREHGFTLEDQHTVEIGGEFHAENVYRDVAAEAVQLEPVEAPDGELFVDRTDPSRGKLGPFYPVYRSQDGTRRYGWLCGNCESTDNAMDTMDRIECNVCGNLRKADRWDAAYL